MSLLRNPQPSTPKEKLLKAQALIKQKRYAEARRILKSTDHPTAREWLKKLDRIAPEDDEIDEPDIDDHASPARAKKGRYSVRGCLLLFAAVAVTLVAAWLIIQESNYSTFIETRRIDAQVNLRLYCEWSTNLGDARCAEYTFQTLNQNRDWILDAYFCGDYYNPISEGERFGSCIAGRGLPLP